MLIVCNDVLRLKRGEAEGCGILKSLSDEEGKMPRLLLMATKPR